MYQRLSKTKINKIILCFAEETTATATAKKVGSFAVLGASNCGINRNAINRYFNIIREKIFKERLKEIGTFELDESYFWDGTFMIAVHLRRASAAVFAAQLASACKSSGRPLRRKYSASVFRRNARAFSVQLDAISTWF